MTAGTNINAITIKAIRFIETFSSNELSQAYRYFLLRTFSVLIVPTDLIQIRLPPGATKIPTEGYVMEIINVRQGSLEYKITKY